MPYVYEHQTNLFSYIYNSSRFFKRYENIYDVLEPIQKPITEPLALGIGGALTVTAGVLSIVAGMLSFQTDWIKGGVCLLLFSLACFLTAVISPVLAVAELIGRGIASIPPPLDISSTISII
jgi:hypothetical protein